ncbi:SPOR domain-containing protein [Gymnodinialimonas sp. 2305UL16-5]|uniref:SPOR domain-containing protein n=1 Tax=Gymnodinialimonas mytili TaxID=3126503 RepID=UPI0030B2282D
MADVQFGGDTYPQYTHYFNEVEPDDGMEPASAFSVGRIVNLAAALVSVALVVGMAVWSWHLLVRDVTDVPVVRAAEGPMRVAPEDPGGSVAENQGLSVNRLAEGEEAAPVPDQLVLAPPPVELAPLQATPQEPAEQAFENASVGADASPTPGADETSMLIDRLLAEAQPLGAIDETIPAVEAESVETIPTSIPGVRRSPRPLLRPASLVITAPESRPAAAEQANLELAPNALEAGTRLVQLGAYDSADEARADWDRLAGQFPDYFTARGRVIEQATSGGQTFYRLRAHGFADLSASRRFCTALIARGTACIPVTVR